MACTVAVETVIGDHYNDQIRSLLEKGYREDELIAVRPPPVVRVAVCSPRHASRC